MRRYTLAGFLAVLFWSTTIAFSRTLSEALGPFTTGAWVHCIAGLLGLAIAAQQKNGLKQYLAMPRRYLLGGGLLVIAYMTLLYLAIGLARSRAQVLAVGLANYLWPALIMLFSVPMQQKRPRLWLLPGILLAVGGAWIATLGSQGADWASLFTAAGLLPVLLAVGAAILWGVYSNVARRWAPAQGSAIPLFLLASGGVFLALRILAGEASHVTWQITPLLLYMAIFPAWLGYQLWDHAMQRGDMLLVTAFSYFSPVFSTLISILVLKVPFSPSIGLAALLVTLGAILSKMGVVDG